MTPGRTADSQLAFAIVTHRPYRWLDGTVTLVSTAQRSTSPSFVQQGGVAEHEDQIQLLHYAQQHPRLGVRVWPPGRRQVSPWASPSPNHPSPCASPSPLLSLRVCPPGRRLVILCLEFIHPSPWPLSHVTHTAHLPRQVAARPLHVPLPLASPSPNPHRPPPQASSCVFCPRATPPGLSLTQPTPPTSPGKSLRVLSTCHSLLANSRDRDFIWVDLQGVESEMEAVSRAVQQLGMRKQVRMGGPHFEKTDFTYYSPFERVKNLIMGEPLRQKPISPILIFFTSTCFTHTHVVTSLPMPSLCRSFTPPTHPAGTAARTAPYSPTSPCQAPCISPPSAPRKAFQAAWPTKRRAK